MCILICVMNPSPGGSRASKYFSTNLLSNPVFLKPVASLYHLVFEECRLNAAQETAFGKCALVSLPLSSFNCSKARVADDIRQAKFQFDSSGSKSLAEIHSDDSK